MSERISIKQLEQLVAVLNTRTNHALQPYTRNEAGEFIGNPGNYHLSGAYGGYAFGSDDAHRHRCSPHFHNWLCHETRTVRMDYRIPGRA